ncbi:MAG: dihydrofolate reductase family protein [Anaerolineae bacterium]|nr:dihydrofolate reductase family protein [Anaerolineae bacterium]
MSNVILYIAASFDGYIARKDGSIDWLTAFDSEDEDYDYTELVERLGTVIMGGKTYRQVLTFGDDWPYADLTSYIVTRHVQPEDPERRIKFYDGDLTALVAQIRAESDKDIWLIGGAELNAAFVNLNLIDEYIVSVIPVMIGDGIPLFPPTTAQSRVELINMKRYPNSIVQLHYKHVRE